MPGPSIRPGTPGIVLLVFLLLLATIGTSAAETTPLKTRTITAAVLNDFAPLYTHDDAGNPAGFAIDILERVATDSGLTVHYMPVENWSKAMQAVRSGEADLIPGIGISPARSAEFHGPPRVYSRSHGLGSSAAKFRAP